VSGGQIKWWHEAHGRICVDLYDAIVKLRPDWDGEQERHSQ